MKRIMTLALGALAILSSGTSKAQDEKKEKKNFIINGSFEEANTAKIKKRGQFVLVGHWTIANEEKVDLFSKFSEYPDVGAPKNVLGISNPKDGDNYVGIATHLVASKDGRSYITAGLDGYLEKGKKYCLSYSVSLADAARYASNNLGFHLSKKPVFEPKEVILKEDVLYPLDNSVITTTEGWQDICIPFTSAGFEKFVTVGNFASGTRTVTKKMQKPEAFKGEQIQQAYYYLDNISLVEIARDSECTCEDKDEPEGPRIIFSKSASLKDNATTEEKVKASTVYFYSNESDLVGASKKELDKLAALMNEKTNLRITVKGHMDEMEAEKGKEFDVFKDMSKLRADEVKQYLVDQGVSSSRILVRSFKDEEPATKMKTPLSLAKNRRVEFELR